MRSIHLLLPLQSSVNPAFLDASVKFEVTAFSFEGMTWADLMHTKLDLRFRNCPRPE
jgi:hypothetical protein